MRLSAALGAPEAGLALSGPRRAAARGAVSSSTGALGRQLERPPQALRRSSPGTQYPPDSCQERENWGTWPWGSDVEFPSRLGA